MFSITLAQSGLAIKADNAQVQEDESVKINVLRNDNIVYIGDLVQKSESEMLRTPNFGRKSLNEIKEVLTGMSLYLGMEIPNWPPDNIAEMSKKLEENSY